MIQGSVKLIKRKRRDVLYKENNKLYKKKEEKENKKLLVRKKRKGKKKFMIVYNVLGFGDRFLIRVEKEKRSIVFKIKEKKKKNSGFYYRKKILM
jgi:hypothetical protein